MRYKEYLAHVDFDPATGIHHGEVVGLRDVITFQSRTESMLLEEFRKSVDDYLEFCRIRNETPEARSDFSSG